MAKIVQLIEIDLNGSSFRLELGGVVALTERDAAVAAVVVHTLAEAERLETLASAMHFTFRWKQGHRRENAISVADFESRVAAEAKRFLPEAASDRLGLSAPRAPAPEQPRCDDCGIPLNSAGTCDVCSGVDFNYPGKHD